MRGIIANTKKSSHDGKDIVPIMEEILESGGECRLKVTGSSMTPILIHKRDSVILRTPKGKTLKKGDIVFIKRKSGEYVLHRIYKILKDGFIMNGDAQTWTEFVEFDQVIGVVNQINRKSKNINCNNLFYKFIVNIWMILRPLRKIIFKVYGIIRFK